jgi:hypothetical protein
LFKLTWGDWCILLGGKKRSPFYYDIWNIKYLKKFKWDDLVGEIGTWKIKIERLMQFLLNDGAYSKLSNPLNIM